MDAALTQMKKQTPKQVVIEWIDHILDRKRWNGTELARKSGLAPSTLLRLLNNPEHQFVPTLKTLQKIADGSGIPITKKVMDALGVDSKEENVVELGPSESALRRAGYRGAARPASVEFRHVSALPASLQAAAGSKRDGYVPAPPQLEGDETAFAFNMPDDSFGEWLRAGALMFGTKRRDPIAGDMVVVTSKDGKTRVRLLTGIDENGLRLTKEMPSKNEETMKFDDIQDIGIVAVIVRTV
ncbi:transcriptional regulator with XRE-family HTH domain [Bradyrhizobium diazoefficiens]|uniref:helix-turn-helix domain-containing protein n=1 Tax=Bradyrhizobium diazoefficiens TaxID=1355477 RepID=UPI003516B7D2